MHSSIPDSIGKLKSLRKLTLHSNNLETLPESIGNLSSLRELGIISLLSLKNARNILNLDFQR